MKKRHFWLAMCAVSAVNGGCFYWASARAMRRGISGADNQAALLFIPLLWAAAAGTLLILNLGTLLYGRKIQQKSIFLNAFRLSGLTKRAAAGKICFLVFACSLMLLAYSLFAPDTLPAAAYALSGGGLLWMLYAWKQAAKEIK